MNILTLLLPALLPAFADGFKALISRFVGNTKPLSVAEQIELKKADAEMMKAIAMMDTPTSAISQWVADLRASFRYVGAGLILITTMILLFTPNIPTQYVDAMLQLSASVFSFMFGDRVYIKLKYS